MTTYNRFYVKYEHTTVDSDTPRINSAVVTIFGESELAMKQAIEKQRPDERDVTILESLEHS